MSIKEQIVAELDGLDEVALNKLLTVVRSLTHEPPSLVDRLRAIQIEAPSDFAERHDHYAANPPDAAV